MTSGTPRKQLAQFANVTIQRDPNMHLMQGNRVMSVFNNIYPPDASFYAELYGGQPKLKCHGAWYETRAGIWPVQTKPNGWMPKVMKALGERFCDLLEQHSQALVVRFDLHVPQYTEDNAQISEFIVKLNYWIKSHYKAVNEVRYVWVREL